MPDTQGNLVAGDPGYVTPGTGLINATSGQTNITPGNPVTNYTPKTANASKATSEGYSAAPYTVAPPATVQEQVKNIVGADSPLMQQAATRAKQAMNEKGLINSSLAVEAGQNAVLSAATPIATADAATYNQAATNTTNAQNAERAQEAQAANTARLQNSSLETGVAVSNAGNINFALNAGATAANTAALQTALKTLDVGTQVQLATLDAQNKQLLQTNMNASNMYNQTVTNIANIQQSTTLDATAKANAIASQLNLLNEGLRTTTATSTTPQAAIAGLNLSSYFGGGGGLMPTTGATGAQGPAGTAGYGPGTVVNAGAVTDNGDGTGTIAQTGQAVHQVPGGEWVV